ncbi:MAG: methyltransferase domain-containing protein [Salibacteraceae bacterium]
MKNDHSEINYQDHWDAAYTRTPNEKLGWYEEDLSPTFRLLDQCHPLPQSKMLIAGAGSTTLVDELLNKGFSNLIATDISKVSLNNLTKRVGAKKIETIVDDLSQPEQLSQLSSVDIWIDRAVLHFLIEENDQNTYFELLKSKVKTGGYALFAEFTIGGATKCCGLPIKQYENNHFTEKLGNDFKMVNTFEHTYYNPNGDPRKYIYSIFKRK